MSGLERKPALPPRRTHPVADLAVAAGSRPASGHVSADSPGTRPVKDQLNVRIGREITTQLDRAVLILSARRGTKLTKADAVEEAIRDYLTRHEVSG